MVIKTFVLVCERERGKWLVKRHPRVEKFVHAGSFWKYIEILQDDNRKRSVDVDQWFEKHHAKFQIACVYTFTLTAPGVWCIAVWQCDTQAEWEEMKELKLIAEMVKVRGDTNVEELRARDGGTKEFLNSTKKTYGDANGRYWLSYGTMDMLPEEAYEFICKTEIMRSVDECAFKRNRDED